MSDDLIKRLRSPLPTYGFWAGKTHVDQAKALAERAEAAGRIEELEERNKELTLQLLATSGQAADALDKLAKAVETLEQITTIICRGVQGDNEHGVRSLNEIAAKNYLKDFPLTLAAITEVQDVIDAVLAKLEGGE